MVPRLAFSCFSSDSCTPTAACLLGGVYPTHAWLLRFLIENRLFFLAFASEVDLTAGLETVFVGWQRGVMGQSMHLGTFISVLVLLTAWLTLMVTLVTLMLVIVVNNVFSESWFFAVAAVVVMGVTALTRLSCLIRA